MNAADMTNTTHAQQLKKYYRLHAPIYDATRWSFLFGRRSLIKMIPDSSQAPRILEIGCGTGSNIQHLKNKFPDAKIVGVDISENMLSAARKNFSHYFNVRFQNHHYGSETLSTAPFDIILLSYSLTMMGNETESILKSINQNLKPGGWLAIVDFHTTPFGWFRKWMEMNHVDFSRSSLPLLKQFFNPKNIKVQPAYFGLWKYYQFIGQKVT